MTALLNKLHSKLGDFWWYSLMLFCAMRAADCLNVFVGLWLVPKYVEPAELGAVMPLTRCSGGCPRSPSSRLSAAPSPCSCQKELP